jgi:hypothetical protein
VIVVQAVKTKRVAKPMNHSSLMVVPSIQYQWMMIYFLAGVVDAAAAAGGGDLLDVDARLNNDEIRDGDGADGVVVDDVGDT